MYDELWVGGKCMYKLEPVLADDGELIIYAPHIKEISLTHGKLIHQIGYHCRDYFVQQWDQFKDLPWGILAHSTHVRFGQWVDGREIPRVKVTLATGIPETVCREINLGYRNPESMNPADYANREAEGILMVPKAGETLFQLHHPPQWARPMRETDHRLGTSSRHSQVTLELIHESQVLIFSNSPSIRSKGARSAWCGWRQELRQKQSKTRRIPMSNPSLKLHNAMWPGLVGKGIEEGQNLPSVWNTCWISPRQQRSTDKNLMELITFSFYRIPILARVMMISRPLPI